MSQAISLYNNRLRGKDIYPTDIDAVLKEKLSLVLGFLTLKKRNGLFCIARIMKKTSLVRLQVLGKSLVYGIFVKHISFTLESLIIIHSSFFMQL